MMMSHELETATPLPARAALTLGVAYAAIAVVAMVAPLAFVALNVARPGSVPGVAVVSTTVIAGAYALSAGVLTLCYQVWVVADTRGWFR